MISAPIIFGAVHGALAVLAAGCLVVILFGSLLAKGRRRLNRPSFSDEPPSIWLAMRVLLAPASAGNSAVGQPSPTPVPPMARNKGNGLMFVFTLVLLSIGAVIGGLFAHKGFI